MGRAQLADPEFCSKAKSGNIDDIDYCVGCNQGCYDGFESQDSPLYHMFTEPRPWEEKENVRSFRQISRRRSL